MMHSQTIIYSTNVKQCQDEGSHHHFGLKHVNTSIRIPYLRLPTRPWILAYYWLFEGQPFSAVIKSKARQIIWPKHNAIQFNKTHVTL